MVWLKNFSPRKAKVLDTDTLRTGLRQTRIVGGIL